MSVETINDIFPPVVIPDNSLYFFLLLLFCTVVLCSFLVYFIYRKFYNANAIQKRHYITILQECNFKNAKQDAYKIEYYAKKLASTTEEKRDFMQLKHLLQKYKYTDTNESLPTEIKEKLQIFLQHISKKQS